MKIIAFGDIHERTRVFGIISDEITSADLVVITGDLTQFGNRQKAADVLKAIRSINANILAQVGNLDNGDIDAFLTEEGINIHGSGRVMGGIGIFGCGGSNKTPFSTPVEYGEEELSGFLKNGYKDVKDADIRIMVCHTPPANTQVDMIKSGAHVGSQVVRTFIEEHQPHLCLTGHIHESSGEDTIGRTRIINPGPVYESGYVIINAGQTGVEAELRYLT